MLSVVLTYYFYLKYKLTNKKVKSITLNAGLVRRVGFEPTNPCGIGASVLRLWPCWATSACVAKI